MKKTDENKWLEKMDGDKAYKNCKRGRKNQNGILWQRN